MITVRQFDDTQSLRAFIRFPFELYKGDPNWVPPLRKDLYQTLRGVNNPLLANGPHTFFMAYKDGKPAARLMAGINETLNAAKEKREGYISLFECMEDYDAAKAILDAAAEWLRERGMTRMEGPISPTNGDDSRGLLIQGFDGPPVLMNVYNPAYYPEFFDRYGFQKDFDLLAYFLDASELPVERFERVVEYAMRKYHFHVDRMDLKNIEPDLKDIKRILDVAMPDSWQHLTPPSMEDIRKEFMQLKKVADPDLLYIARTDDGEPIGFVTALPDYNQVLIHLNGRLGPIGALRYLYYRRRIRGARILMQFVVPQYRNKAVNSAIFAKLMVEGRRKRYLWGEASTIAEMNTMSRRSVEGAGGKLYRLYRLYYKEI